MRQRCSGVAVAQRASRKRRKRIEDFGFDDGATHPFFLEVFIPKGFKSCVLAVRILKDLVALWFSWRQAGEEWRERSG